MFPWIVGLSDPPTPAPTTNMTDFLNILTGGFTEILEAVVAACSTIVSTPFLLFTVLFLFAGGVIGILGRLLSRN